MIRHHARFRDVALAAGLAVALAVLGPPAQAQGQNDATIKSIFLDLSVKTGDLSGILAAGRGGAIEPFEDGILGIDKTGRIFFLAPNGRFGAVPSRIETNAEGYYALRGAIRDQAGQYTVDRFRVIDLAIREAEGAREILVSHDFYDAERRCVSLRVSALKVGKVLDLFTTAPKPSDWVVIFETEPCLAIKWDADWSDPVHVNGHASGGRLAVGADLSITMSVGDFENDGVNGKRKLAQDDTTSYGKIIRLTQSPGGFQIISKGHRNPQGLTILADGRVMATEHGPQGGDELNAIVAGRNYGWPSEILGANYEKRTWPLSQRQGRHETHEAPLYAWLPSIGISSLIEVRNFAPEWDGDLLIASLRAESLYRTRVIDDRVLFTEKLHVGARIRDMVQDSQGRIVLWTDAAELVILQKAPNQ